MSLRRKTYDGNLLRRSDDYSKWGNTLDSQIPTNESIATKRARKNRYKINSEFEDLQNDASTDRYLLTYSDIITLLLGLFIILYAISNVDVTKYEKMMQNIGEYFGNQNFANPEMKSDYLDLSDGKETLKTNIQNFINENIPMKMKDIAHEFKHHFPFTVFSAVAGIIIVL